MVFSPKTAARPPKVAASLRPHAGGLPATPPTRCSLTVIVAVKNEEQNIATCLKSLDWVDQVFVVDSQSTDSTVEIAKRFNRVEVAQFYYDGGWPKKVNWSLQTLPIHNPWVLVLGCDERVSPELREEIRAAITEDDPDFDGFYLRWKFVFLGRWMKHCWNHGWQLRLFRHGRGQFEDLGMRDEGGWDVEVHENIVVKGRARKLTHYLWHESQTSLTRWIQKQNEFSDWNAVRRLRQKKEPIPGIRTLFSRDPLEHRRFLKAIYLRLPCKPLLMFIYLYFVRLGFLDGQAGRLFCWLRAAHELNIDAKLYEHRIKEAGQHRADTMRKAG